MGWRNSSPPREKVEVMQSTHGLTYVTWPTNVAASGEPLPSLPIGHSHPQSRHWVMADRTAVVCLPGDPTVYEGGVIRWTFDVVSATWNRKSKTLASLVKHPSDPDINFAITTTGSGCSCTQGVAGNAGPINGPYEMSIVNADNPEFDWFVAS